MRRVISILAAALMLAALCACGAKERTAPEETGQVDVRIHQGEQEPFRHSILFEEWKSFDSCEANLRLDGTKRLYVRVVREYEENANSSGDRPHGFCEIVLIDDATGEETVLMRGNGKDGLDSEQPFAADIIDERYFVYVIGGYDGYFEEGIYDLQEMKRYPAKFNGRGQGIFAGTIDGTLYYISSPRENQIDGRHLWATDISRLDESGTLQTVDLLKGTRLGIRNSLWSDVSRDGQYYVLGNRAEVAVIDLKSRREIYRLEKEDLQELSIAGICFEGTNTVYIETQTRDTLLEIETLKQEVHIIMAYIGWAILGLLGLFIVVTLIRAAFWRAKKVQVEPLPDEPVDEARAAAHLSGAIQIPTIANDGDVGTDWAQFERFHAFLDESYPLTAENLPCEVIRGGSLLYHWKGKNPALDPIALLSHIDVVPVTPGTEDDWEHPPFSGHNDGEFIWGRGAMDMKNHLICVMEAVETLLEEGFTPGRDVYLCFGDNEEILGHDNSGARYLRMALEARGVTKLESTLDEGGAMLPVNVKGILNSVLAGVGIAEKGHCDIEISVNAKGGHASQPPDHTALGELAKVIQRLEKHQFKAKMTPLMRNIIDSAGRRLPYWLRIFAVNHRLLRPLLLAVMKKIPPAACMVRTTTAVTQATGSPAPNVLPQKASIVANFRMMPGTTTQDLVAHIKKVARNKNIEVEVLQTNEASKYSSTDSKSFEAIRRMVFNFYPQAILAPFLVMGGTDTIKYDTMSEHCYRFSPFLAPVDLLLCTHATNERLPVAAVGEGVRFFKYYIKDAAG